MNTGTPEGFKRIHTLPRRYHRHSVGGSLLEQLRDISPRQRYIREQSLERFKRRADAYLPSTTPMRGEIGRYEGFRFINSEPLDPEAPLTLASSGLMFPT